MSSSIESYIDPTYTYENAETVNVERVYSTLAARLRTQDVEHFPNGLIKGSKSGKAMASPALQAPMTLFIYISILIDKYNYKNILRLCYLPWFLSFT